MAITSGVKDMQVVLNLVWEKLLPAMQPEARAADRGTNEKLRSRLASLTLPTQQGDPTSDIAAKIAGTRYSFPANEQKIESLELDRDGATGTVTLISRVNGTEQRTACGSGTWLKGRMAFERFPEQPVAACGAWTAADTYSARFCFYETPFFVTVNLKFGDGQVAVDSEWNVGFGPTKRAQLIGAAAAAR